MTSRAIEFPPCKETADSAVPNFNRLARIYRWMEWLTFGPFLQRCRCTFLSGLAERRRALVLGDGDGRFTARLIRSNSGITVDAVDASEAMLRELASRSPVSRVRTHLADARTFTPIHRDFDLVATHFFLDCLSQEEVCDLASHLRQHVTINAVWIISEFAIPSDLYGRTLAAPLIRALYFAFGLLTKLRIRTLPNHHAALTQSGWSLLNRQTALRGLLVSERWQLDLETRESLQLSD
jgi:SAM-dependent methyltransferase